MYSVFPAPRRISYQPGDTDLSHATWIRVDPAFGPGLVRRLLGLAREWKGHFRGEITVTAGAPEAGRLILAVRRVRSGIKREGFRLACTQEYLLLEAADDGGAFYGLCALDQILDQAGARLLRFRIDDHPDFARRGYLLDVSRCKVPTMDTLHLLVERLARVRINELQLYLEHTFAYSAHRAVWKDSSPFTPEQLLELDAYCAGRFIELVPNQNSFGHFERWLRHPAYHRYAECPDGFFYPWDPKTKASSGSVLKPDEASLNLLDGLYGELLPNFRSRFVNIGCDETWELGHGASRTLCEQKGKHRVFFDHLKKINALAKKHGRQSMFWADILLQKPDLVTSLPKNMIALDWGYEANHPFEKETALLAKAGVSFYVCPGTSSWNSIVGRTENAFRNCAVAARAGLKRKAAGYLVTDWGDNGHIQPLALTWTGLLYGAGSAWCLAAHEKADVAGAADRIVFRDENRILGKLTDALGRVHDLVPGRLHNSSIFHHLLFSDQPLALAPDMRPAHLKQCLELFDKLEAQLKRASLSCPDAATVKAELHHAIAMARFACRRGLALLKDESAPSAVALKGELKKIIRRHAEVWRMRNRPGGLAESLDHFRKRLTRLP